MDDDTEQAAYHQMSVEEQEREELEREHWERIKFSKGRPWWYLIDQDKGWIARIDNAD